MQIVILSFSMDTEFFFYFQTLIDYRVLPPDVGVPYWLFPTIDVIIDYGQPLIQLIINGYLPQFLRMSLYYIIILYTTQKLLQFCKYVTTVHVILNTSDIKEQKVFVRGQDLAKHFMNSGHSKALYCKFEIDSKLTWC